MNDGCQRTSTLAIIALVLGLLGLSLPAIICGHIARSQIRRSHGMLTGGGFALAGIILGYFMLVVTVVVVILALLVPAGIVTTEKAARFRVQGEALQLESALLSYFTEYSRVPPVQGLIHEGDSMVSSNSELMSALRGSNPRAMFFFDGRPEGFTASGNYVDHWGTPFRVLLDTDGDYGVTYNGRRHEGISLVISAGKDGVFDTTDDVSFHLP